MKVKVIHAGMKKTTPGGTKLSQNLSRRKPRKVACLDSFEVAEGFNSIVNLVTCNTRIVIVRGKERGKDGGRD